MRVHACMLAGACRRVCALVLMRVSHHAHGMACVDVARAPAHTHTHTHTHTHVSLSCWTERAVTTQNVLEASVRASSAAAPSDSHAPGSGGGSSGDIGSQGKPAGEASCVAAGGGQGGSRALKLPLNCGSAPTLLSHLTLGGAGQAGIRATRGGARTAAEGAAGFSAVSRSLWLPGGDMGSVG